MDLNGTLIYSRGVLNDYVTQYQDHLPSTSRLAVLGLVNIPLIVILLNGLWQLVRQIQRRYLHSILTRVY